MFRHEAYILLLEGKEVLQFIDGLSTNLVNGRCTTIFTQANAKIIDVCEILPLGENVAIIGYRPYKDALIHHLKPRILERQITIRDITTHQSCLRWPNTRRTPRRFNTLREVLWVVWQLFHSVIRLKQTWDETRWNEYRINNLIPYHGAEITPKVHPFACGLDALVHPNKGCYVGQEILTRMRSRGKTGKTLVRKGESSFQPNDNGSQ